MHYMTFCNLMMKLILWRDGYKCKMMHPEQAKEAPITKAMRHNTIGRKCMIVMPIQILYESFHSPSTRPSPSPHRPRDLAAAADLEPRSKVACAPEWVARAALRRQSGTAAVGPRGHWPVREEIVYAKLKPCVFIYLISCQYNGYFTDTARSDWTPDSDGFFLSYYPSS